MPDHVELASNYHAAWAARDPDAILALHTADSVFEMHGLGESSHGGRRDPLPLVVALFENAPDITFSTKTVYLGADHPATKYVVSGTVSGTAFAWDAVDVLRVRDELVARKDSYFDADDQQAEFRRRLSQLR